MTLEKLLTTDELVALLPISRATFYRLRSAGKFFAPVRVSDRRVCWRERDLVSWLALR